MSAGSGAEGAFATRTIVLLLAIGLAGFIGMLVLGAYAPDLRSGRNGGAHALSDAATGYSGIIRLAEATGRHPEIIRNEHLLGTENLVVLTPESGAVDVGKVLAMRRSTPILMVLPKWQTLADPDHSGWARSLGLRSRVDPEGVLAPATKLHIARHPGGDRALVTVEPLMRGVAYRAPHPVQVITGSDPMPVESSGRQTGREGKLRPLVTDGAGGIVVAQLDDRPFYIVSDPDLLSNIGMRDIRQAGSALAMLDYMNSNQATGIAFDVTLNGFGHSRSPLRLAFDPPFLAMTLAIAAALLLAGIQAGARFGPPRLPIRAIAFGKAALIDNAAMLVRKAGRQATLGRRYSDAVRGRAVTVFGVPGRLRDAALDAYLDRLGGRARFTQLAAAARDAQDGQSALEAARALHGWLWETKRDG